MKRHTHGLGFGHFLDIVVSVMKMGNIVPGIPGQCATITPRRLPDVTTILTHIYVCSTLPQVSADYYNILLFPAVR